MSKLNFCELRPRFGVALAALALAGCVSSGAQISLRDVQEPVAAADAARGRAVVMGRDGNCLLCHAIPETGARFMGDLGPVLSGIGARMSPAQLRSRLIDSTSANADSIMPAYARTEGLTQVGQPWRGKPILSAQQIEDVVAYLVSLR
ncbi:MAG: sulfur oxidation c-type cytochrome SoxX [Aeromicrobium sp.]|nr:sulfur oxidation c-type cytochrome SoxX [Burkholderiales bacterium]